MYHIVFFEEVKKVKYTNHLLKKINDEILMLGKEYTDTLNFKIEHSFRNTGCTPCEQARKEREENERKNKANNTEDD